jgi:hypothetical protein
VNLRHEFGRNLGAESRGKEKMLSREWGRPGSCGHLEFKTYGGTARMECAEGQNRTAYAGLFRAALYR